MMLSTPDGQILAANAAACRMLERTEEELCQLGRSPEIIVMDHTVEELQTRRAHQGHARAHVTLRRRDGSSFTADASTVAFDGPEGPRVNVMFIDVTEQSRTLRALEILAKAGRVLGESLDIKETLQQFTSLVVPQLADICVLDVIDKGRIAHVIAHRDPSKVALVRAVRSRSGERAGVEYARKTGKPQLVKRVTRRFERENTNDEQHFQLVAEMGVTSFVSAPLVAHGTVLGAFTLASTGGASYDEYDLALATSLADQVALAIDNAQTHDAAVQAARLRDEVLEVVSHDLKNPLNAIKLSASSLARRSEAEEVPVIRRAVQRAERLVEDLLDVAKMEFTTLPLDRKPTSIRSVIDGVVALHETFAVAKGLELTSHVDGEGDVVVDRHRIAQLLDNLVSNAIKFTEAGCISLRARLTDRALVLEVQDTGRGIEPEMVDHIFDRFWQSAHAGRAGAGLGLAIARGIAQAHGGDLTVTTAVGQGSTFAATLPIARANIA
jgi:PAS domain S-box-containing protein